ncbi:MAG: DUF1549 domain-containing protein [Planctomycetia bacterium]|nr:DUF1549 domain-containing protein [Planctomycetia bacterium]
MWARNLLFAGVCLGGAIALAASLSPVHARRAQREAQPAPPSEWQATVDRLNESFRARWQAAGVVPAARATDLAIARRLSLALEGTIPSLAEIRDFEAHDEPDRIAWWLAGLFADRRSSDYLAERLARAYVGTEDGPFLIYRRRRFVSWLADELYANRPYNQLVEQLITESGLWTDKPATNFITVTSKPDEDKGPDPNALAARVSRAFLGVRLDCAECHDHFFREWKQTDFQSLAAFFSQTEQSLRGIRDGAGPIEVEDARTREMKPVACEVPFAKELLATEGTSRERLARWVTHPDNRAFACAAANRAWAILFGRPLVEPIDDIPAEGHVPEALAILADDFVAHGYDLRRLITVIALSEPFQRDSRVDTDASEADAEDATAAAEAAWAVFPLTRLRPEQVVGSLQQAASLETLDYQSHIVIRFARAVGQSEFVKRYGDSGEDEFSPQGGTIPQRLLMMNGELVKDKTKDSLIANASTRVAVLASTDEKAVEIAYLTCLTRRPTEEEEAHFVARLAADDGPPRRQRMEDIYWALINSTEFSWNH